MPQKKEEIFTRNEKELSDFANALSHPARIKILKILANKNSCICGEIVDVLPLAQSTVSQHLKELKKVDLIIGEVEGPRICYCVNKEKFIKMTKLFNDYFIKINKEEA